MDKKIKSIISDPLIDNNPITKQVLGFCSALAGNVNEDNINSYDFRFQNNSKFPIKLIDEKSSRFL